MSSASMPSEQQKVVQMGGVEIAANEDPSRLQRLGHLIGDLALSAVVGYELSPLNEVSRMALAGAVQAVGHNPLLSASVYVASTFAVEAVGAVAGAKLLDSEKGQHTISKIQAFLGKMGINKIRTNPAIDMGVALVAGTPAALVLKQQQDPERTVRENMRYGTILSLGATALAGPIGYLGAEGVARPNPLVIGAAVLGVGTLFGLRHLVGEKLAAWNALSYESYAALLQDDGPQRRGYQSPDYEAVISDNATQFIPVQNGKKVRQWPVLADIRHNTEYVAEYFEKRYGSEIPTYYLSLPPRHILDASPRAGEALIKSIMQVAQGGARIVLDQRVGAESTLEYVQNLICTKHPDVLCDVDSFIDPRNDTPAEIAHYQCLVSAIGNPLETASSASGAIAAVREEYHRQVQTGEIDLSGPRKTVVIDPEDMDRPLSADNSRTNLQRLAEIYEKRFTDLTSEYPVRGIQKSDELEDILRKPTTLTVAQMVGEEIVAFTYIADVRNCEWLNPDHYERAYPGEFTFYFPGIAADRKYEGRTALGLMRLLGRLVAPVLSEAHIVFQCTNFSKEYIPNIVKLGIAASGTMKIEGDISETDSYRYYGLRVNAATSRGDIE
jgi:hypothetical protein